MADEPTATEEPTAVADPPTEVVTEPVAEAPKTLFDEVTPEPEPVTEPVEGEIAQRPENIPDKFWDAEMGEPRIDALLKSETHWRDQYQRTLNDESGVPEDASGYFSDRIDENGDYLLRDGDNVLQAMPADDPILMGHKEAALKFGLTKKQADGYWDFQTEVLRGVSQVNPIDNEVEMAKLGDRATERISGAKVFFNGLDLPDKIKAQLATFVSSTADGILMAEAIMAESGQLSIPLGTANDAVSKDDLQVEWELLGADPAALDADPRKAARYEKIGNILHPSTNKG